ncbi:hypothetical protein AAKU67_001536 [Oxalobacteraceae bacterium GrIS 2.11]
MQSTAALNNSGNLGYVAIEIPDQPANSEPTCPGALSGCLKNTAQLLALPPLKTIGSALMAMASWQPSGLGLTGAGILVSSISSTLGLDVTGNLSHDSQRRQVADFLLAVVGALGAASYPHIYAYATQ